MQQRTYGLAAPFAQTSPDQPRKPSLAAPKVISWPVSLRVAVRVPITVPSRRVPLVEPRSRRVEALTSVVDDLRVRAGNAVVVDHELRAVAVAADGPGRPLCAAIRCRRPKFELQRPSRGIEAREHPAVVGRRGAAGGSRCGRDAPTATLNSALPNRSVSPTCACALLMRRPLTKVPFEEFRSVTVTRWPRASTSSRACADEIVSSFSTVYSHCRPRPITAVRPASSAKPFHRRPVAATVRRPSARSSMRRAASRAAFSSGAGTASLPDTRQPAAHVLANCPHSAPPRQANSTATTARAAAIPMISGSTSPPPLESEAARQAWLTEE